MTTQPKFVPNEAVKLTLEKAELRVRLVDCVGYLAQGVIGHLKMMCRAWCAPRGAVRKCPLSRRRRWARAR